MNFEKEIQNKKNQNDDGSTLTQKEEIEAINQKNERENTEREFRDIDEVEREEIERDETELKETREEKEREEREEREREEKEEREREREEREREEREREREEREREEREREREEREREREREEKEEREREEKELFCMNDPLEHYTLGLVLGKGNFGTVFKAVKKVSNNETEKEKETEKKEKEAEIEKERKVIIKKEEENIFAVKVIPISKGNSLKEELKREIKILKSITHRSQEREREREKEKEKERGRGINLDNDNEREKINQKEKIWEGEINEKEKEKEKEKEIEIEIDKEKERENQINTEIIERDKERGIIRKKEIEIAENENWHINILYEAFRTPRDFWIVLQIIEGGSLSDILRNVQRGFKEKEMRPILSNLLIALSYLQSHNILHRDIKAANLLLDIKTGNTKLADFGISVMYKDRDLKSDEESPGSPYWMSPEIIQHADYSYNSDIWSTGITAIELAEQFPPFFSSPPFRVLFLIGEGEKEPSLKDPSNFSKEFIHFISLCLIRDTSKRPEASSLLNHEWFYMEPMDRNELIEVWKESKRRKEIIRNKRKSVKMTRQKQKEDLYDSQQMKKAQSMIRSWVRQRQFRKIVSMALTSESFLWAKYRLSLVKDLLLSEQFYLQHLNDCYELYYLPLYNEAKRFEGDNLKDNLKEPMIIRMRELNTLFSCYLGIRGLVKTIVSMLNDRYEIFPAVTQLICDIYAGHKEQFEDLYSRYLRENIHATSMWNFLSKRPAFKSFVSRCSSEKRGALHLADYLSEPLKRLIKITHQFEDLTAYTPTDHIDFRNLCDCRELFFFLTTSLRVSFNEEKRRNTLRNIQNLLVNCPVNLDDGHRVILKEGTLKIKDTQRISPYTKVYVF